MKRSVDMKIVSSTPARDLSRHVDESKFECQVKVHAGLR